MPDLIKDVKHYEFSHQYTRELYMAMSINSPSRLQNLLSHIAKRHGIVGRPVYKGNDLDALQDFTPIYSTMTADGETDMNHQWEVDGVWVPKL